VIVLTARNEADVAAFRRLLDGSGTGPQTSVEQGVPQDSGLHATSEKHGTCGKDAIFNDVVGKTASCRTSRPTAEID
jgi:hypothetical protein